MPPGRPGRPPSGKTGKPARRPCKGGGRICMIDVKNRPVPAPEGDCVVGLFDDDDLELDELLDAVKKYPPCVAELTEANVQAIFDRCLAKEGCAETSIAISNLKELGYERKILGSPLTGKIILRERRNIEYLFGQLGAVHHGQRNSKREIFLSLIQERAGRSREHPLCS